jgi:hypothetical protein
LLLRMCCSPLLPAAPPASQPASCCCPLQHGKGNWKTVHVEAGDALQHRSVVDLKDKWRNLEKAGLVGREAAAPAAGEAQPLLQSRKGFGHACAATGCEQQQLALRQVQVAGLGGHIQMVWCLRLGVDVLPHTAPLIDTR